MYIILRDKKLIIEIDEDEDLEDYEKDALDKILSEDFSSNSDIGETKTADLNIEQTHHIYSLCKIIEDLTELDIDKLLIYWLRSKDIDFYVENDINSQEWQRDGYRIIDLKDKDEIKEQE